MANFEDSRKTYHKEIIIKQEGRKWVEYYAVLSGTSWIFTGGIVKGQKGQNGIEPVKIEVNENAFCAYGDKSCYRFPFWVQMGSYKYNFKCETKIQRFRWMYAIRLCASRSPPQPIPSCLPPGGMIIPGKKGGEATNVRRARLSKTQSCDIPSRRIENSDFGKVARCSKTDSILEETRELKINEIIEGNDASSTSSSKDHEEPVKEKTAKESKDSTENKYPRWRSLRKSINHGMRDFLINARRTSMEATMGDVEDEKENLSKSP